MGTAFPSFAQTTPAQNDGSNRMFGVLPNYTTVEKEDEAPPVTTKQTFRMAALSSFDPVVYPFVALTAEVSQLEHQEASWGGGPKAYAKRYATAFADNTIGNFMTTAIVPAIFKQDPRYFERGDGTVAGRLAYAATRIALTRARDGRREFNISEVGGTAAAAGVSNLYHPSEDRTFAGTLGRWGSQMMWDMLSNELKEFWPDVRNRLHRAHGSGHDS
jgi:hypothetical protein